MAKNVQRRLAAILAADVVGYSRLMGADEAGTLARLGACEEAVVEPLVARHNGRIVKRMGDGFLVEFGSVVDAVECGVAWQKAVEDQAADAPGDPAIRFRIGINIGDVVVKGDDIYGDGVNIAARLEGLAEPGGICLSGMAYQSVKAKTDVPFEDLGEREVKNIAEPVRVYAIAFKTPDAGSTGFAERVQVPSDRPSIAVLPFDNLSGDPEQEYFSDGVSEDIITELSRYPDFLVIARNSTFVYKGQAVAHKQIARDLGVQFVLEGSVRRSGDRIRVTAQLIDAQTSHHLWAERFDRTLDDIFAVQDEITSTIVGTLGDTIQVERVRRATRKDPSSLDAYDKTLQAWAQFNRFNKQDNAEARRLAEAAIALDGGYARAQAILAWAHVMDFSSHWTDDPDESLRQAYAAARKAVSLDDHNAYAHLVAGACETWTGRHDQAREDYRRAIELNPNDADTHAHFANHLVFAGRADEALEELKMAMRLNPHYPVSYLQFMGRAYFTQRRYQEAESAFERVVTVNPGWPWAHLTLAATRAALGKIEEAKAGVTEALSISPGLTLAYVPKAWPFKNAGDVDHLMDLLRKAGLPD